VAALVYGTRIFVAGTISNRYLHAPLRWYEALLIPLKDLFVSTVWFLCFWGDEVHWSGHTFRVLRDGQMVRVSPDVAELAVTPYRPSDERDRRPASI
jgi:hypothetical protein